MINSIRLTLIAALLCGVAQSFAADNSVRPEVGTPLQEAQALIKERKSKDALAKANEAAKVPGLTSFETYVIERVRASAATAASDYGTAIRAYEAALVSPHLDPAEKTTILQVLVQLAFGTENYSKAASTIQQYQAAGGTDAEILHLLPQALYLAERHAEAHKALDAQLANLEKAGKAPTEAQLRLLGSIALKQNDNAGYLRALEKLVTYHPTQDYWLDAILRTASRPGFSDRLTLDVYRLRSKTGTLDSARDYVEAAQLALQAGFPAEAQQFIQAGYASKVLGSGSQVEVDRHQRLAQLVSEKVKEDRGTLKEGIVAALRQGSSDALVASGVNLLGYGEYEQGIRLIEQGIQKGKLSNPETAKLHLGYAYLQAGRHIEAVKVLRSVQGNSGEAELSRLWIAKANGQAAT